MNRKAIMLALMTLPIISTSVSAMDGDKLSRTTDNIGVGYNQANGTSYIDLNDAFHKAWNDGDIENSIATKLGLDKDKYAESFKNIQQIEHSIVMDRTKKEKKLNIDEFVEIEYDKKGESVYDPAQNRFVHNELFTSNVLITTGKGAEEEIQDYLLRLSVSNYNYVILENLLYMIADNQARTTGELLKMIGDKLYQRAGNLTQYKEYAYEDYLTVVGKIAKSLKDVAAYVEAGGLVQFTQSIAKMADTYTDFASNNMVIAQPKDKQDEMVNKPISNINFKQTKTGENNNFSSDEAAPLTPTQDGDSFNLDVFSDTPEYTPTSSIDKKAIDNALLASLRAVGSAVIKGEVTSSDEKKDDGWKIDEMVAIFLNNIAKFTQAHEGEAQMGMNLMESLGITDQNERVSFWRVWGQITVLIQQNKMQKLPSKWFTDDSKNALTDMIRIIDRQTPNSTAQQSLIKETMQEGTNILFNNSELNNMQQSNKGNTENEDNLIAFKTPLEEITQEIKSTPFTNIELNNMQQGNKDNMNISDNLIANKTPISDDTQEEKSVMIANVEQNSQQQNDKGNNENKKEDNNIEKSHYTINDFTFYNNDIEINDIKNQENSENNLNKSTLFAKKYTEDENDEPKITNKENEKNNLEESQNIDNEYGDDDEFSGDDEVSDSEDENELIHNQSKEKINSNSIQQKQRKNESDNQIEYNKDLNNDLAQSYSYLAESNQSLLQSYKKLNENPEQTDHIIKQKD